MSKKYDNYVLGPGTFIGNMGGSGNVVHMSTDGGVSVTTLGRNRSNSPSAIRGKGMQQSEITIIDSARNKVAAPGARKISSAVLRITYADGGPEQSVVIEPHQLPLQVFILGDAKGDLSAECAEVVVAGDVQGSLAVTHGTASVCAAKQNVTCSSGTVSAGEIKGNVQANYGSVAASKVGGSVSANFGSVSTGESTSEETTSVLQAMAESMTLAVRDAAEDLRKAKDAILAQRQQ
jgi:hypothetical protein